MSHVARENERRTAFDIIVPAYLGEWTGVEIIVFHVVLY